MRSVKPQGRADFKIAQPVGKEAVVHAIQAKIEGGIRTRRGGDGISAGVLLAIRTRVLDGDKLAGDETKLVRSIDLEFEMLGLRRQQDGLSQPRIQQLAFEGGAFLRQRAHDVCLCRCGTRGKGRGGCGGSTSA